jgi:outer membrane protein
MKFGSQTFGIFAALILAANAANALEVKLGLAEYLRMVVERNETIQAQLLATESARRRALAENGAFEPELVGSASRVSNRRPNTVEQERNLAGVPILDEKNWLIDSGIESFTNTGAKVRLGYTLNNFDNNLSRFGTPTTDSNRHNNEWQSFAGLSVTQPLLKNGGRDAALANLRLAAIASDSAFQEYRRQLMVTLSQAESAYWGVYFSQEQLRFLDESVSVADSLLSDSKEKVKAGKGADLDVLEAEAGLALRRTKRNEARQKFTEALGQLLNYVGKSPLHSGVIYLTADEPALASVNVNLVSSMGRATELNPDYILQRKKLEEALLKLGVARNQRLPELNLKGSYGMNGLGSSPGESFDEITNGSFPSWSVGLEFRIPLGGGIRGDNEYEAMRAGVRQVQMQLQGIETQLANALNTSIKKLKTARSTTSEYRTMIRFNEDLLKTERERLNAGKIEGRRVLEVEAGLYEVKQGLADALVQSRRAQLELQLAEGSVLERRGMEFTPADLRDRTLSLMAGKRPASADGKAVAGKKTAAKAAPKAKGHARFAPSRLDLREDPAELE